MPVLILKLENGGTVVPPWNFQTKSTKTPLNKGRPKENRVGRETRQAAKCGRPKLRHIGGLTSVCFCGLLLRVRGLAPGGRGVPPAPPPPAPAPPSPGCALPRAAFAPVARQGAPRPRLRSVPPPPAGAPSPAPPWRGIAPRQTRRAYCTARRAYSAAGGAFLKMPRQNRKSGRRLRVCPFGCFGGGVC